MEYYNVNNPAEKVSLRNAVLQSSSSLSGLYMPVQIPALPRTFFERLPGLSLQEIACEVAEAMLGSDVPPKVLRRIVDEALSFPIPLKELDRNLFVLELFHGPTLAFKDIGARFMAGLFNHLLQNDGREVTLLVATSGDTGSAAAHAFFNQSGVRVVILYPSGQVSELQEKQLTTMGGNISALEVDGSFDDCQRLVKQAFSNAKLNRQLNLASANSINFARLFPQSFYYFHAMAQLGNVALPVVFSIPSGNFGNLTAGLIAKKMGLPVHQFIAATNINHVVPDYLSDGQFIPRKSHQTISNAMDVGNPSNFPRMLEIYGRNHRSVAADIKGYWFTDEQTRLAMKEVFDRYGYQTDPHGAIAYSGLKVYGLVADRIGIFLETAHPAKFSGEVERVTGEPVLLPKSLKELSLLEKKAIKMPNDYTCLRDILKKV